LFEIYIKILVNNIRATSLTSGTFLGMSQELFEFWAIHYKTNETLHLRQSMWSNLICIYVNVERPTIRMPHLTEPIEGEARGVAGQVYCYMMPSDL